MQTIILIILACITGFLDFLILLYIAKSLLQARADDRQGLIPTLIYPEHNRRRSAHPQTLVAMYCDKDNRERYAIMDLDKELLETIRRALTMYRCGLYEGIQEEKRPRIKEDFQQQYDRAGIIVEHIESL